MLVGDQEPALSELATVRVGCKREGPEPVGHEIVGGARHLLAIEKQKLLEVQVANTSTEGVEQSEQLSLSIKKHPSALGNHTVILPSMSLGSSRFLAERSRTFWLYRLS